VVVPESLEGYDTFTKSDKERSLVVNLFAEFRNGCGLFFDRVPQIKRQAVSRMPFDGSGTAGRYSPPYGYRRHDDDHGEENEGHSIVSLVCVCVLRYGEKARHTVVNGLLGLEPFFWWCGCGALSRPRSALPLDSVANCKYNLAMVHCNFMGVVGIWELGSI
jgi:hypothetical protein